MAVRLTNSQRNQKVPGSKLRKAAGEALTWLGFQNAELSVLITGDRKMRTLNRDYRGKDKTTDVLSFPAMSAADAAELAKKGYAGGADAPPVVLGDIVISAPRAFAQASERGVPFEDELVLLLAHGILHLAGYDHEAGPGERKRMFRKQRELVQRLEGA